MSAPAAGTELVASTKVEPITPVAADLHAADWTAISAECNGSVELETVSAAEPVSVSTVPDVAVCTSAAPKICDTVEIPREADEKSRPVTESTGAASELRGTATTP
ncbi:unnamed protein product [Lupinus luteus]|uniref:Uncharacterized protein n=1 Tax=Lupinus luteus TaxID=3873 RepID=A0AAV1YLQ3_LUPLU